MTTRRIALQRFFTALGRPHTGEAFIHAHAAFDATMCARLDQPCSESSCTEDVVHALAAMPLGRAITRTECTDVKTDSTAALPCLSDNAVAWLLRGDFPMAARVASLFANAFLKEASDPYAATLRLQRAFETLATPWITDYAGVARVARLIAAQQHSRAVVAQHLAEAALLVAPQPVWHAVHEEFGSVSREWNALESAFRDMRLRISAADPYGHDRLLAVYLFPRDLLLPLPQSGLISDVRLTGPKLGLAWPGARAARTAGPLAASPLALDDAALLTHVLLPVLAKQGITLPWPEPRATGASLHDAVGQTPSAGGWPDVLLRVIDRYRFADCIEQHGYSVDQVAEFVCGGQGSAPAARVDAPAARLSTSVAEPKPERPAPVSSTSGPTYSEILASLRRQGVLGHDEVLQELSLLCDARVSEYGAAVRVLLSGPPGCGKSTILAGLATAAGRPFVRVDASTITEHGWSGLQCADVAAMCFAAAGGDMGRAERALVCLDEVDKLRSVVPLPGTDDSDGTPAAADPRAAAVRVGRQEALLALLDSGPAVITFTPANGTAPLQLRTRQLVVIAAGAFRGLQLAGDRPTEEELERYGFITEFAARFTTRLVLKAPTVDDLEDLFLHGPDAVVPATSMCRAIGFELVVVREAVRLVAAATAAGCDGLTPRTGAALLGTIARRALFEAMDRGSAGERRLVVGPDEVMRALPSLRRRGPQG